MPAASLAVVEPVTCHCGEVKELAGAEAARYVTHLRLVAQYGDAWEAEYVCDQTGHRWREDYPHSELHGAGPPRLHRIG